MVNAPGAMAGACAMLFMDMYVSRYASSIVNSVNSLFRGSISALDALATVTGDPILGYSTSMDLVWHAAATP